MHSWNTSASCSVQWSAKNRRPAGKNLKEEFASATAGLRRFLQKVYHELRNLGQSSRDRAINYAATKAFEVGNVFDNETKAERQLHSIDAEPSLACRLGSDCWDVILSFFSPEQNNPLVKQVYRFTVDVSDVVPVILAPTNGLGPTRRQQPTGQLSRCEPVGTANAPQV